MSAEHRDSNGVKIGVVGTGHVGATFAFALVMSGMATEIVLVDADRERAEGEAMDLGHAVPFSRPVDVRAGVYADLAGAAVTVIAAGVGQKPGETRLDLLRRNVDVFREIVPRVTEASPEGIIVAATNPVDVLTHATLKLSGLPPERVIGSGTILDTARFRYLLGRHFGVDPRSVHAAIAGEHGDSEVPLWSLANIAGVSLAEYAASFSIPWDEEVRRSIFERTRDAAYGIITRKGSTYYAVAAGLMRLVEAIVRDQHTILAVSSLVRDFHGIDDICLSLPTVIGRAGIVRMLRPALTPEELAALRHSAEVLTAAVSASGL